MRPLLLALLLLSACAHTEAERVTACVLWGGATLALTALTPVAVGVNAIPCEVWNDP